MTWTIVEPILHAIGVCLPRDPPQSTAGPLGDWPIPSEQAALDLLKGCGLHWNMAMAEGLKMLAFSQPFCGVLVHRGPGLPVLGHNVDGRLSVFPWIGQLRPAP